MSQTKAQLVSGTTAQDLTVDNINTTSVNSGQPSGRKNLVINGAMQVAQRGTSSTSGGYQTVDRFPAYYTGGAMTQSQGSLTSGSPFEKGFTKYLRITNTTANTGTDGSRSIIVKLEAQDIANSGWNYKSSSSYLTFSFWVRSSVSQQFYIVIKTLDGTQQMYPFSIGTPSADTWTKVTHSIAGNSNLTFDSNNANGLQFYIYAFLGTDNTSSGVSLNGWSAWASSGRIPDMTNTWAATTDATFDLTGVQLEVGSTATDFEHRSFGQELALCQRYYQRIDGSTANTVFGVGNVDGSTQGQILVQLPVSLRVKASSMDTTGSSGDYKFRVRTTQSCDAVPTLATAGFTQQFLEWHANSHGFSDGDAALGISGSSSSFLAFSAEL